MNPDESSTRVPPASSRRPTTGPIQYKGADLDARRGPGLGCFRFQLIVLVILVIATPLSVTLGAPPEVSAALLFIVIALLLLTGQTIIFLLRLVAAERRGRRRPLASATPTVGEIEEVGAGEGAGARENAATPRDDSAQDRGRS
ncbi:MAG TPA: hypothetical protein VNF73_08430 [Candidatus Saccharimonadales bacterium]|nr:hypothetical protein [Candidatus Saccharimonadales bacterium]